MTKKEFGELLRLMIAVTRVMAISQPRMQPIIAKLKRVLLEVYGDLNKPVSKPTRVKRAFKADRQTEGWIKVITKGNKK